MGKMYCNQFARLVCHTQDEQLRSAIELLVAMCQMDMFALAISEILSLCISKAICCELQSINLPTSFFLQVVFWLYLLVLWF